MNLLLPHSLPFSTAEADALLSALPMRQMAVFALVGEVGTEPYIGVAADLRRRLSRLLIPDPAHPRRLQLASRVRSVAWREAGSALEAQAVQFHLLAQMFGERALERMHLRPPAFVRFHGGNPYPRLSVTTRVVREQQSWLFGPFASRTAAERYSEDVLKLFLLRRCEENLAPHPSHPGCIYGEMKKCLAPCFCGCTDARYREEAEAVEAFLATRGDSRLRVLHAARDAASAKLEFERAAALHAEAKQAEAVSTLAPELVRPLATLRACLLLPAAQPDAVAIFLFAAGALHGPELFSTLGMRIQNEASVSTSLFAQPMLPVPLPLSSAPSAETQLQPVMQQATVVHDTLQERLDSVLAQLESRAAFATEALRRQGDLSLLTRWYYRPAQKRGGEIFFAQGHDSMQWPGKAILRGIGRIAASQIAERSAAMAGSGDSSADRREQD